MSDDDQRLFTADEANAALPKVAPLVEQLHRAQGIVDDLSEEVQATVPTNGGGEIHRRYRDAAQEAADALGELTELGIVVRDAGTGLIDFPSERDGQVVYLCWKLGEDEVAWWHPPETGFAGRQPL